MRISDFLANLLDFGERDKSGNLVLSKTLADTAKNRLNIEELALFSTVDLVASTAAMCEWKTYQGDTPHRGEDWYRWNIEPNQNMNGFYFKRALFARLLRFNEALVFQRANGSVYLADGFGRETYAFKPNVYSSITCNNLTLNGTRSEDEVFYFRLANQDAAALLHRLHGLYSEAMEEAMDKYKHSGGRSGVLKITGSAVKDKNFEDRVATLMEQRFKKFFENKNAVIPLFDGYDYTPDTGPAAQKLNGEIADLESIMKQAQDRSCNAYHVPPTLLRGDVTNQNDAVKSMLTFAVKPPVLAVQTEVNRKMYGRKVLEGWHTKIDMTHIRVVDIFDVAVNLDKLIQDSVLNTNESREMTGLDKIPEAWADEYQRTKNMEAVTTPAKGGENT